MFLCTRREIETIQGAKLLCIADFHLGSEVTTLSTHSLTSQPNSAGMSSKPYNTSLTSAGNAPAPVDLNVGKGFGFNGKRMSSAVRYGDMNPNPSVSFDLKLTKSSCHRTCTIIGTMDGSVGMLLPVEERVYKRLNLLQHLMSMTLNSTCALNPKDYRILKTSRLRLEKKKGVLDGTMLWKFISLPLSTQEYLAKSMGTTIDTILDNLYDLNLLTQFI